MPRHRRFAGAADAGRRCGGRGEYSARQLRCAGSEFDAEEVEALRVGLLMLARTGDSALQRAALRVRQKITDLNDPIDLLQVAP